MKKKNLMLTIAVSVRLLIVVFLVVFVFFLKNTNDYPLKSAIVIVANPQGSFGTGFVTEDGIYTAFHVIDGADTVNIYYYSKEYTKAYVKMNDTLNDIALLKPLNPIETKILEFANDTLKELDDVFSIGHPNGLMYMQYKGYVHKEHNNYYIVSFDVVGGMSGAPLLGKSGKVYGIILLINGKFSVTYARKMINYGN